ncbi:DNA primase [Lysinibacillus sp. LZ02]|uniref:DNA primase n=1 Tax=Lysinibacillus sp. LZ02 TaxID=3420668 RepID=UPI003D35A83E
MIRSVGTGGTNLNGQAPRRTQSQPRAEFPKIGTKPLLTEEEVKSTRKQVMVGVKPNAAMQSILDEEHGVMRLNADGDRLEVSKKAISLAKEKLFV